MEGDGRRAAQRLLTTQAQARGSGEGQAVRRGWVLDGFGSWSHRAADVEHRKV